MRECPDCGYPVAAAGPCDTCLFLKIQKGKEAAAKLGIPDVLSCDHTEFLAEVSVNRITNDDGQVEHYNADVKVTCSQCGVPFRFIGLPAGLNLNGAATSADALEARLAIAPKSQVVSECEGTPEGFSIRRKS